MFSISVTVALSYGEIKWNPEIVSNAKSFRNKYNWKGINYPLKIDDWKTFQKNVPTIALYISKINSNCEKQIIVLIIPNEGK